MTVDKLPTCDEVTALARAKLHGDAAVPQPETGHPHADIVCSLCGVDWDDHQTHVCDGEREAHVALARFVEAVLSKRGANVCRVNVHGGLITINDHTPKMDNSHIRYRVSAIQARAIAADLLYAADKVEQGE